MPVYFLARRPRMHYIGNIEEVHMDISEFENEIEKITAETAVLKDEAEAAAQMVVDKIGGFLVEWARKRVEDEVTLKPELTKRLGPIRLKKMKEELDLITKSMPSETKEEFKKSSYWPHREKDVNSTSRDRLYDNLDKGIELLTGKAQSLLISFGFMRDTRERLHITWADPLKTQVGDYVRLYEKLLANAKKLAELKKEKEEAEARDLWDKA